MSLPVVDQILVGYCKSDNSSGLSLALGSVTLVRHANVVLLVDVGSPWTCHLLLKGLAERQVSAESVSHVVCTHGHIDHVGNLNCFPRAEFILDHDVATPEDQYGQIDWETPRQVTPLIEVFQTPGHTNHDVSVLVRNVPNYGNIVIAGDIIEAPDDENIWQENSWNASLQRASRERILQKADWIIPGHGPMFQSKIA